MWVRVCRLDRSRCATSGWSMRATSWGSTRKRSVIRSASICASSAAGSESSRSTTVPPPISVCATRIWERYASGPDTSWRRSGRCGVTSALAHAATSRMLDLGMPVVPPEEATVPRSARFDRDANGSDDCASASSSRRSATPSTAPTAATGAVVCGSRSAVCGNTTTMRGSICWSWRARRSAPGGAERYTAPASIRCVAQRTASASGRFGAYCATMSPVPIPRPASARAYRWIAASSSAPVVSPSGWRSTTRPSAAASAATIRSTEGCTSGCVEPVGGAAAGGTVWGTLRRVPARRRRDHQPTG